MMLPFYQNIPFFSIFACMVAGITMPIYKKPKTAFRVTVGVCFLVAAASLVLTGILLAKNEFFAYKMGHFPAPWGNEIAAGPLEAALAVMFSLVMGLSLLGGRDAMEFDILPEKQNLFCLMMCLLQAAMLALTYTNDVFTGYVFIEISTIAACAIVMARDTAKTIAATIRYLVISLLGSGLFLIGIVLLYCITGHLLMPDLQEKVLELVATGAYRVPLTVVLGLITTGLAIKSALFPFHAWLPFAHGGATTSASAVLSGLVLKGYIVFLIKLFFRVFTIEVVREMNVTNIMFAFGIAGMLWGSVQAMHEEHIKRMLANSSIAQIGYVFMGLGLGTGAGVVAAVFHIFAHAVTKPLLFLSAGRLSEVQGHEKSLYRLRGAAREDKLAGVCFTVGALSMIGIPLFAGFVGKYNFAEASLLNPRRMWFALLALAASSVLNAMYYIPAVIALWTPSGFEKPELAKKRSPSFAFAACVLAACVVGLGVCSLPVTELIRRGLALL